MKTEINVHILAYNMRRVASVLGAEPPMKAIRPERRRFSSIMPHTV